MKPYVDLLPYAVIFLLVIIGAYYTLAHFRKLRRELHRTKVLLAETKAEHRLRLSLLTHQLLEAQRQALACDLDRKSD